MQQDEVQEVNDSADKGTDLKILHVGYSDAGGGAAIAMCRLHDALVASGVSSKILVSRCLKPDLFTVSPYTGWRRVFPILRAKLSQFFCSMERTSNPIQHSLNVFPSPLVEYINRSDADIVNLHWINNESLSIFDLKRIRKPLVWTLHDSWPFCATEHHPHFDGSDLRFLKGYNIWSSLKGFPWSVIIWKLKKISYPANLKVVCPSTWLTGNAKKSLLLSKYSIISIPNPINTDLFRPHPKMFCRSLFSLPTEKKLILFGAQGGISNPIKGWDCALAALRFVASKRTDCALVVLGQGRAKALEEVGMPIFFLGHLHDEQSLALLFSACDVTLLSSRIENLPQVGTESVASGTPVVAFKVGGLPEIIDHKISGWLATAFDVVDLAEGILWATSIDQHRIEALRERLHEIAKKRWSSRLIAERYVELVYKSSELMNPPEGFPKTNDSERLNNLN